MSYNYIQYFTVLVLFCDCTVSQVPNMAQRFCEKVEFSQLSFVSAFRGCFNPRYDNFIIKDYNVYFRPFHPTGKQYLSNIRANSCAILYKNLTFNQFTYIECGIFLKSVRSEYIEIVVEDVDRHLSYPIQYYGVGRWENFNRNIQKNITNAQVLCIYMFLN